MITPDFYVCNLEAETLHFRADPHETGFVALLGARNGKHTESIPAITEPHRSY
jgi:hypothetical protein